MMFVPYEFLFNLRALAALGSIALLIYTFFRARSAGCRFQLRRSHVHGRLVRFAYASLANHSG
eukprot:8431689-Pyramimonas_sp.AAC.1